MNERRDTSRFTASSNTSFGTVGIRCFDPLVSDNLWRECRDGLALALHSGFARQTSDPVAASLLSCRPETSTRVDLDARKRSITLLNNGFRT